jgi:hypothetical protein
VWLAAADKDESRALKLYEWNAQLSAAFLRDLAHVEVGLRNAYDGALSAHWPGPVHWTKDGERLFAPLYRTRSGRRVDVNVKNRKAMQRAVREAGGASAPPGKVIAELNFGFWRYLSSAAHEKVLWVPYLHHGFRPRTDRRDVDRPVGELHDLRNRVAHHEPLLRTDIAARCADVLAVADLIDPHLALHISATSTVMTLQAARP